MESSPVNAVGIWFYAQDTQRYLYLLRNDPRHPSTWGLAGGKIEEGETRYRQRGAEEDQAGCCSLFKDRAGVVPNRRGLPCGGGG